MMNIKTLRKPAALAATLLLGLSVFGAGCFSTTKKTTVTGPDSGIWKTSDRGVTWINKKALVDGAKITAGAAELAVQTMAFDKQDRNAIYLGTQASGLVYSLDGGDSWTRMKSLDTANVTAVAVDTQDKCNLYATSLNRIYRTKNCGRDWEAFFDPRTNKTFTRLAIDWFTPTTIYAGNDDGDIFKSTDQGVNWTVAKRVNASVTSMAISPQDSRVVYVGTDGDGIWKSLDGGVTWIQIRNELKDIDKARNVVKLVPDALNANRLYLVHRGGIAKSEDQGQTWQSMSLIGSVGENQITDLAIDPNDGDKLAYTGPTALVFTNDGGVTWEAKKLPTTSQGTVISFDAKDGNVIYLGTVPTKKKK